jgi:hypothetical protein
MKPKVPLRQALADPQLLGGTFVDESWGGWKAILLAAMGEVLTDVEREHFRRLTGRDEPPEQRVEELWAVVGRRGGKSRAIAVLIAYVACLCSHREQLVAGERGTVLCLAPRQAQAGIILEYVRGILEASPVLKQMVVRQTSEQIELDNRIRIDIRAASFRGLRGFTTVAAVFDEMAFFLSDESANPDVEILNAVRPSLGTTSGLLAVISSPHARRGELWKMFRQHFGAGGDERILVCHGATRALNPAYPQVKIDREYERDPQFAAAEFGAEFRTDIESFLAREVLEAVVTTGVRERQPQSSVRYTAFVDPSGGSSDSFTLAIAHREGGDVAVLDLIREAKPPFSPETIVKQFASDLRRYRLGFVTGDRFGGEWVREAFRREGVSYGLSDKNKSEIYLNFLPLVMSRRCDLLCHPFLIAQLVGLERRTSRGGRDSIDHFPGGHDDIANAVAGAIVLASALRGDGKTKVERVKLPEYMFPRERKYEPGTGWMAGWRR